MRAALAWALGMTAALVAMFALVTVTASRLDHDRVFNPPPASSLAPALSCTRTPAGAIACQENP